MSGDEVQLGGLRVFACEAGCPVCGESVESAPRVCERCGTPHHAECWDYAGRCAMYACQPEVTPAPPTTASEKMGWLWRMVRPKNPDRCLSLRFWSWVAGAAWLVVVVALVLGYEALRRQAEDDARRRYEALRVQAGSTQR